MSGEETKIALKIVEKIGGILASLKRDVSKESEELSLRLPEHLGEYSVLLKIRSGPWGGKIHFPIPNMSRVQARSLPAFQPEDASILREDGGFTFDPGKLSKGVERVLLRFDFEIEERNVLENIVRLDSEIDPLGSASSDVDKYWMTAQLKSPLGLRKMYSRLELLGVNFRVDVGVHQEIKAIPREVKGIIERSAEFGGTTDRNKLTQLVMDQRRSARFASRFREDFRELAQLFLPTRFRRYIAIEQPFRYYNCEPGMELFETSFVPLPKFMTVISRTNLSLDEPAKEGFLLYKKKEVRDEIKRIFPESKEDKS